MGCSPPGSSVREIFQARILEWVAISFSGDLPNPGIKPKSPALQADALTSEPSGKQDLLELTPKKDVLFIIGDWTAKVGSQETPGVTGKFVLGVQNEAGQGLIEFCPQKTLHGHHQMAKIKIRLIIFFTAKDGEARYSQQKQDQELTVAQTMNSLLPNSD